MTRPFRVLIAEDSPIIREILAFLLQENGYETCEAGDGVAAVQEVLKAPPDLVLLDVDMPRMNGYQVCRLLKNDSQLKTIPVIMLTSRDRRMDRLWGMSTGADAYVLKGAEGDDPFENLAPVLEKHLEGKTPGQHAIKRDGAAAAEDEVFERLASLLDQRLFVMTMRNRVGELAHSLQSLDETVRSILSILDQLVPFCAATLVLAREGTTPHTWLLGKEGVGPAALFQLGEKAHASLGYPTTALGEAADRRTILEAAEDGTVEVRQVDAFALRARQKTIGVVAFGYGTETELDSGVRHTVELLLDHAALVLDNAQLYADLENTYRRLKATLDELTSTQDKLAKTEMKVHELQIIIDQQKKSKKVSEIVESEYFQSLKERVRELRKPRP